MKSLWQDAARRELHDRLARLAPTQPPRWGRLSAPQMLAHVTDALRMALGELPVHPKRAPIRYPPLKQLVVYWLPWPKGVPTAPELLQRPAGEWKSELAGLHAALDRFAARDRKAPWPMHPAFGRLSRRAWGVQQYRHLDHHLRQFGV